MLIESTGIIRRCVVALAYGLATILFSFCTKEADKDITVTSIRISHRTAEMQVGETLQLTANILPSNATNKTVIWASSKQSVATVSGGGLVTAVAEGYSTITASCGGKAETCVLTVNKGRVEVLSVSLNYNEANLKKGETISLVAVVNPSDASDQTVMWKSTNDEVVEVDQNGKALAKSGGVGVIIAKAGSKEASCFVTVIVPVTSIEFEESSITMVEGESRKLSIHIKPEDATDKGLIWSSSNNDIVSVSDGVVLAGKPGRATITATLEDKTAHCLVSVVKDAIVFADLRLKAALVSRFDTNNDGEISYGEAAAVSSIAGVFEDDTSFKSFDEFQFFTGVSRVPNNMFEAWGQLESIVLPDSIVTIGESAFSNCLSLQQIIIPNGVQNIGDRAFQSCTRLKTITIPQSVESLGSWSFSGCSVLETITLPNGLRGIGWGTFSNCKNLGSIELPEQLISIGIDAFKGSGLRSIIIPSSVQNVRGYAFQECKQLSTVSFNNPKTEIEHMVFNDCSSLSSVSLPSSIKRLADGIFWGCTSLQSIVIPKTVTVLDVYVFYGCSALRSIVLPQNVVSIGGASFYRCSNLKTVTVQSKVPPVLGDSAFYRVDLNSVLVPKESVDAYKNAEGWKEYSRIINAL